MATAIPTKATSTAMTDRATAAANRLEIAGVLTLAASIGWLSGAFFQPIPPAYAIFIDLLHLAPLLVLIPLAMSLFTTGVTRGVRNGINGVIAFLLTACVAFIVLGASNSDPNSVGVHSVADWAVVACVTAGAALWFAGLARGAKR